MTFFLFLIFIDMSSLVSSWKAADLLVSSIMLCTICVCWMAKSPTHSVSIFPDFEEFRAKAEEVAWSFEVWVGITCLPFPAFAVFLSGFLYSGMEEGSGAVYPASPQLPSSRTLLPCLLPLCICCCVTDHSKTELFIISDGFRGSGIQVEAW